MSTPAKKYDFDEKFQNKVLAMLLRDEAFANRVEGLCKPEYFDSDAAGWLANLHGEHFKKYRQIPSGTVVTNEIRKEKAAKRLKQGFVDELKPILKYIYGTPDLSNRDYTADAVSVFARERAIEAGLLQAADQLENGADVADIRKTLGAAMDVGDNDSQSRLDILGDLKDRIDRRTALITSTSLATRGGITTGHKELDAMLYHKGWGRKELYCLMGGLKSGKSMGLVHFAINAAREGHNVLYVTLENSADITADRMDANVADVDIRKLDVSPGAISAAWDKFTTNGGGILKVEELPMYTTKVSDIRRLIRRYQSQSIIFDLIVVDYADIMASETKYSEKRHESAEVYAHLRNLGKEENAAVLTATQSNREGMKANTAKATDVAEDINKGRLVDLLLSINADDDEKKRGEMRLWFAAARNTEDGVGLQVRQARNKMKFIESVIGPY